MKKYFALCFVASLLFVTGCSMNDYKIISGEVKSNNTQDISLDIPVRIDELYVTQWQDLKLGDKLVKLDFSEIEAQITDNENQLKIANLELEQFKLAIDQADTNAKGSIATVNTQKEVINKQISVLNNRLKAIDSNELPELKQILNNISNARKAYEKSKGEFESNRELYNQGAISKAQLKAYIDTEDRNEKVIYDLQLSFDSLKQNYTSEAKQALLNYQQQLYSIKGLTAEKNDTQILIQREKISQIKAKIEALKLKLKNKNMTDNVMVNNTVKNGSITEIYVKDGSSVAASQNILSIIDTAALYIQAYLPEYYSKGVKVGSEVIIIPYADKSRQLTGVVKEISGIAIKKDNEAVLPIKIEYKDPDKVLLPNFGVDVKVPS
jgi:multidrug resistance efflux pump